MNFTAAIEGTGAQKYLVVRWDETPKGELMVRERWPLHMDKLTEEKRQFFMEQAAARLHKKIKKMAGMK